MVDSAPGQRGRHWVVEVAVIEWRRWRSLIARVLFYLVVITAGCLCVASEFDPSAPFFQDKGIDFADVIMAPLGVWWGWFLLALAAAYAIRPHLVTAIASFLAMAVWFWICFLCIALA